MKIKNIYFWRGTKFRAMVNIISDTSKNAAWVSVGG